MHVCVHAIVKKCVHVRMCVRMHMCAGMHGVLVCACMCVCMHMCACMHGVLVCVCICTCVYAVSFYTIFKNSTLKATAFPLTYDGKKSQEQYVLTLQSPGIVYQTIN